MVFCGLMYNWDLFDLGIVKYDFYLSKEKIQYRYDHLFAHRKSSNNHTLIHCRLNMSRKQNKSPGKFGGGDMLTRHYLVVTGDTTFEDVFCKENEYSVYENTLSRCVDGFETKIKILWAVFWIDVTYSNERIRNRATSKVAIFSKVGQKINQNNSISL